MYGRAAVVTIETNPGRIVLFGIRPQHRAQTHATLPAAVQRAVLVRGGRSEGAIGPGPINILDSGHNTNPLGTAPALRHTRAWEG